MAMGKMARGIIAPLVILNLAMFAVALGLSGWMMNRFIERGGYGGNQATPFLAIFSLIAGMVGIASAITGLHHVREGSSSSAAAAQATSWITWLLLILAFCLAWKEIHIGGRSVRHRVLEAFIIMLTATKLAETLAYYFGDKSRSRHDAAHGTPTTYDSTV
ncbi:hypothetical protein MPTK1_3g04490 [Marchantia polymorpha subsp. ruderalis]|uniref:Uncharacterized protein n=2 Tax=Marchantia polymorpha TaxID=3197 RepID=A0AAF6AXE2_MARPO|nr:hypothetical protein MARPO_0022s0082 [Marchantia polymorpha]BBN04426.1 hypothetical protein Mp_3g04490 [Marchantia polymorpha subsp. ruderalis]|eukprot:PTQ43978.1 hypothetical protein MARPO_0022s0082 [Marchantia polymorpha]